MGISYQGNSACLPLWNIHWTGGDVIYGTRSHKEGEGGFLTVWAAINLSRKTLHPGITGEKHTVKRGMSSMNVHFYQENIVSVCHWETFTFAIELLIMWCMGCCPCWKGSVKPELEDSGLLTSPRWQSGADEVKTQYYTVHRISR